MRWVPRLTRGRLSFASPKESSQRKGDPRVTPGCADSPALLALQAGRLRNSGFALRQCSPTSPGSSLRCSALHEGISKPTGHSLGHG
jgi:hypothetical protein